MEANELMLGDWVTFKDCQFDNPMPIKIIAIGYQEGEENCLVQINGDDACDIIDIDDEIVGIPLTPEILEKNGFVKSERYEVWKIIQDDYEMRFTPWRFAVIFLEDGADKEEFSIPRPDFVHELQNALRLCGIDKEIVL